MGGPASGREQGLLAVHGRGIASLSALWTRISSPLFVVLVLLLLASCTSAPSELEDGGSGNTRGTPTLEDMSMSFPRIDGGRGDKNLVYIDVQGKQVKEHKKFPILRFQYGVPEDFLMGDNLDFLTAPKQKGSSRVIISKDGRYLAKTMRVDHWDVLHGYIERYSDHMLEHADSLLPRLLSAFKRKDADKKELRWVVMFNIIRPPFDVDDKVYDLKGTACIDALGDRKTRYNLGRTTFKDLEFVANEKGYIHVTEDFLDAFLTQLKKDVEFLKENDIMEYSLLVSVSKVTRCLPKALKTLCKKPKDALSKTFTQAQGGFVAGVNEDKDVIYAYNFGLIDIHEDLDIVKQRGGGQFPPRVDCATGGTAEPVQNAAVYQDRFVDFVHTVLKADVRDLSPELECVAVKKKKDPEGGLFVDNRIVDDGETMLNVRRLAKDLQPCQIPDDDGTMADAFPIWAIFLIIFLLLALVAVVAMLLFMRNKARPARASGVELAPPRPPDVVPPRPAEMPAGPPLEHHPPPAQAFPPSWGQATGGFGYGA